MNVFLGKKIGSRLSTPLFGFMLSFCFLFFSSISRAVIYAEHCSGVDRDAGYPTSGYCLFDDFSTLSPTNTPNGFNESGWLRWATYRSSGDLPLLNKVNDQTRLRLNSSKKSQATASAFQYKFPAKENKIVVTFDHYAYQDESDNRDRGDGIAIVLSTGNPKTGGIGGALGYTANIAQGGYEPKHYKDGFNNGWLAIGFDEYGNSSTRLSNEDSSDNSLLTGNMNAVDLISIRGSGDKRKGYRLIDYASRIGKMKNITDSKGKVKPDRLNSSDGSATETGSINTTASIGKTYRMTIDLTNYAQNNVSVTVEQHTNQDPEGVFKRISFKNSNSSIINVMSNPKQSAVPDYFQLSITASTGGNFNAHEIDNFHVYSQLAPIKLESQVDHYAFNFEKEGASNEGVLVEIRACKKPHAQDPTCAEVYAADELLTFLYPDNKTPSTGFGIFRPYHGCEKSDHRCENLIALHENQLTFKNGAVFLLLHRDDAQENILLNPYTDLIVDPDNSNLTPFIDNTTYCNGVKYNGSVDQEGQSIIGTNCRVKFIDTVPFQNKPAIHHYAFDYPENTPNCTDKPINIRACLNEGCSELYKDKIELTLNRTLNSQWLRCSNENCDPNIIGLTHADKASTLTFMNGRTQLYLRNNDNSADTRQVPFSWIRSINYDGINGTLAPNRCNNKNDSIGSECKSTFSQSALHFVHPIAHGISGKPSDTIAFRAVQSLDNLHSCEPRFKNVTRTVTLAVRDQHNTTALVDAFASPLTQENTYEEAIAIQGKTDLSLYFNANGEALLRLNYLDAGKIKLELQYEGSEETDEAIDQTKFILLGDSLPFIVRPYGLCIIDPGATNDCKTADLTQCHLYKRVDESFPLTIKAKQWMQGDSTHSKFETVNQLSAYTWNEATQFGEEMCNAHRPDVARFKLADLPLQLSRRLLAPAETEAVIPKLRVIDEITGQDTQFNSMNDLTIETAATDAGIIQIATAIQTELDPSLWGLPYLDETTIPASASSPMGTFAPYYFLLASDVKNSKGAFSYMDDPNIGIYFGISAHSMRDLPVYNYGYFPDSVRTTFKLTFGYDSIAQQPIDANTHPISACGSWNEWYSTWHGDQIEPFQCDQINIARDAITQKGHYTPDGPFLLNPKVDVLNNAFHIPFQTELNRLAQHVPILVSTFGLSAANIHQTSLDATEPSFFYYPEDRDFIHLRFGYLKIEQPIYQVTAGEPVTIPFEMLYFDNHNGFITNKDDSSTRLYSINPYEKEGVVAHYQCRTNGNRTTTTKTNLLVPSSFMSQVTNGRGQLTIDTKEREPIITYWFLMGSSQNEQECQHPMNGDSIIGLNQPYAQFDPRGTITNMISPSIQIETLGTPKKRGNTRDSKIIHYRRD